MVKTTTRYDDNPGHLMVALVEDVVHSKAPGETVQKEELTSILQNLLVPLGGEEGDELLVPALD